MQYHIIDAFTDQPFKGNPAAVCLVDQWPNEALMQNIAAEFNLSETVFAMPKAKGEWDIRWFTPTTEVDLCGHATLATAAVLFAEHKDLHTIHFHSRSGVLEVTQGSYGIQLGFPKQDQRHSLSPEGWPNLDPLAIVDCWDAHDDVIIEVTEASPLATWKPNLPEIARLHCRGVAITSPDPDGAFDFISRFFAPRSGVPEDPVTGSSFCKLAPLWSERLKKSKLKAFQASARGGVVELEVTSHEVFIRGHAVKVAEGTLSWEGQ